MKITSRIQRVLRRRSNQKRIAAGMFVLVFAAIGAYLLIQSFAAASTVTIEPEEGLLTGAIGTNTNANAGGGMFVRFDEPAGTPPPSGTNWPANNIKATLGFFAPGGISNSEAWLGRSANYQLKFVNRRQNKTEGFNTFKNAVSNNGNRTVVMALPLAYDPGRGCTGQSIQFKASLMDAVIAGSDDAYWKQIGQHIKANKLYENFSDGRPKLILRPGWESNGGWYCWTTTGGNAAKYVTAFRRVHDIVEAEVGHKMVWVYGLNAGTGSPMDAARSGYPGDSYVDIVEFDVYDNSTKYWQNNTTQSPDLSKWSAAWDEKRTAMNNIVNEPKWASKYIGIGEWATNISYVDASGQVDKSKGGGGDNPSWITAMHDYLKPLAENRRIAYQNYFDGEDDTGDVTNYHKLSNNNTMFPSSATRFLNLFR